MLTYLGWCRTGGTTLFGRSVKMGGEVGLRMSKHYTDDEETTACAKFPVDALPDGDELVDNSDELTCPRCKEIYALVVKVATQTLHGPLNPE